MFKRILVAIDGTPTSTRALSAAIGLAKDEKAELHVLHVIDETVIPPNLQGRMFVEHFSLKDVMARLRDSGAKILARAEKTAQAKVPVVKVKLIPQSWGAVAAAILTHADKIRADVIVLGTHGRRGLARMVMGSDAESVLREATVPVLLVRAPAKPKPLKRASSVQGKPRQPSRRTRVSVVRPAP